MSKNNENLVMLLDTTGRQIRPLNIVTYPQRRGSDMWMNLAMVVETGYRKYEWSDIPEPFIRVLKFPTQRWNDEPGDQFKRPQRTSVLRVTENVFVVAPDVHCLMLMPTIQEGVTKMIRNFWDGKRTQSTKSPE